MNFSKLLSISENQEYYWDSIQTNIKVKKLEKMVNDMAEKIVSHEFKVKEIESKECNKVREAAKTIKDPNKIIKKKDTSKDLQIEQSKDKVPVFKFGATARKTVSDQTNIQEEGKDKSGKDVKRELCDYRCEKPTTLKKHIKSEHAEQKSKICGKKFETSMKLICHIAIEHDEEDEILNEVLHSTPNNIDTDKNSSFVFHESMLNDFL